MSFIVYCYTDRTLRYARKASTLDHITSFLESIDKTSLTKVYLYDSLSGEMTLLFENTPILLMLEEEKEDDDTIE